MRDYARQQTAVLLRRLVIQVNRAARTGDADAIHDLRVAIRRLSRCLRVFGQFYPGAGWKKMRRRLKEILDACAGVRDRDIALELLAKAGFPAGSIVVRRLHKERGEAMAELMALLHRWRTHGTSKKWRAQLGL
jgi:CHAD domain-containing protein